MRKHVLPLDPDHYERHLIHGAERTWAETNCYVDVWIELLHAWGFEPIAALPFTVAIDFEGDQWTFFKFPHPDLQELYGLDVQELAIWRPLVDHLEEQVALGRPVLVELDSFYLPDTAGTAYQRAHVKSTVAVNEIDAANERMSYFHNQGYYRLEGDDFANAFRSRGVQDPSLLPPYVEFVKPRRGPVRKGAELVDVSLRLLRRQLGLVPRENPFHSFKRRLEKDLEWLTAESLETFHLYSFATLRQFGACFELSATYLQWLAQNRVAHLGESIQGFAFLATAAKTMQFQLARAMARKKPLDLSAIDGMAKAWDTALMNLQTVVPA
jgi:hypothetical protein